MTDRRTLYHRCQLSTKPNPELIYAALMLLHVTVKSFSRRDGPARTKKETETIPKNLAEVVR